MSRSPIKGISATALAFLAASVLAPLAIAGDLHADADDKSAVISGLRGEWIGQRILTGSRSAPVTATLF